MISGKEMLDLIIRRQSDRKYSDRQVEADKLERIIEAGRMAPSACNSQPWKFVVVNDPRLVSQLAEASTEKLTGMNSFLRQAPILILIVRENPNFSSKVGGAIKKKDYSHIDIGIASENICLQAAAEGIGSCIIGWFDEKQIRKILGVPSSRRIEIIISLGYSLSDHREKKRKPKDLTVSYNRY
jgi:nitroreductase